jgi:hypothetical protein
MFVLDPGWVNSRVIDLASRTNGARPLLGADRFHPSIRQLPECALPLFML